MHLKLSKALIQIIFLLKFFTFLKKRGVRGYDFGREVALSLKKFELRFCLSSISAVEDPFLFFEQHIGKKMVKMNLKLEFLTLINYDTQVIPYPDKKSMTFHVLAQWFSTFFGSTGPLLTT